MTVQASYSPSMEPDDEEESTASPSPEWSEPQMETPQSAHFIQVVDDKGEPLPMPELTVYTPPCEQCAEWAERNRNDGQYIVTLEAELLEIRERVLTAIAKLVPLYADVVVVGEHVGGPALVAVVEDVVSYVARLKNRLQTAEARPCVEICIEERAKGNGGCGACALCCKEWREQAEAAKTYPELAEANAVYAQKIMSLETELEIYREHYRTTFRELYPDHHAQRRLDFAHADLRQRNQKAGERFKALVNKLDALDVEKRVS